MFRWIRAWLRPLLCRVAVLFAATVILQVGRFWPDDGRDRGWQPSAGSDATLFWQQGDGQRREEREKALTHETRRNR